MAACDSMSGNLIPFDMSARLRSSTSRCTCAVRTSRPGDVRDHPRRRALASELGSSYSGRYRSLCEPDSLPDAEPACIVPQGKSPSPLPLSLLCCPLYSVRRSPCNYALALPGAYSPLPVQISGELEAEV